MPPTDIPVPPVLARSRDPAPARVGRRAVALVLDTLLGGLAGMAILTAIVLPRDYPGWEKTMSTESQSISKQIQDAVATQQFPDLVLSDDFQQISNTVIITLFFTLVVYFTASEMMLGGTTLGKKVFGLRAARLGAGEPPRLLESLCRNTLKTTCLIAWFPLVFGDALPILFHPSRRATHDYLARTIVTGSAPPPARDPEPDGYDHDDI